MVLPLSDDNSDRTLFPFLTIGLIAINVLVFVLFQGLGSNLDFTFAYSTVPAEIISGKDLVTEDQQEEIDTVDGPQQVIIPGGYEPCAPVRRGGSGQWD